MSQNRTYEVQLFSEIDFAEQAEKLTCAVGRALMDIMFVETVDNLADKNVIIYNMVSVCSAFPSGEKLFANIRSLILSIRCLKSVIVAKYFTKKINHLNALYHYEHSFTSKESVTYLIN